MKALVRNPYEAAALAAIGVELVQGDITQADDVLQAAKGCDGAIHCGALLGGASRDLDDGLDLLIPWLRELGRL